ncbi:lysylphosphatidylglycerol synthase transmembrane domain-containing protein [Pseudokineococcus basanitobsidens]|uniref:Lysylphosphatidylglycerol synthase transmembrane domain-containing protein n=1 Tax=Pseudokineococcus basanitobsidens TaxID=1926649 RepID=A0ABU8RIK5_9ACTN
MSPRVPGYPADDPARHRVPEPVHDPAADQTADPTADLTHDPVRRQGVDADPPSAGEAVRHRRRRRLGTVVMVLGGAVALALLATELAVADLGRVLSSSSPAWFAVVLGGALLTFVGAATTVVAVSPVTLRPLTALAVQVAGTFVNLLGPAGLGGMALNARHMARRGAGAAAAVAAVVAVQATSLVVTAVVLAGVVLASGRTAEGVRLLPGAVTLVTAGVLVALVGVVLAVRPLRSWVLPRVREPLQGAAAALRGLARAPERLVLALVGSALVTGGFLLALGASVAAYGASVPLLELAVVLFAGTAVGSLFPTPGGVGAVEAAITGGLVAVGVPAEPALLSAVTYRIATLWLWVAPGWVLTLLLRRAGDL